jgi:hypothetical protein
MPYDLGSYSAVKLDSRTYAPIYSRSGELLVGGTLEKWDRVPAWELGPFVLGDIIEVDGWFVTYHGDDYGGWFVPERRNPLTGTYLAGFGAGGV